MSIFIQEFRAIDTISPVYDKLTMSQNAMIGDMRIAKAAVEDLNRAFAKQAGVGELTEEQQKRALRATLAAADAEINAAAAANTHSRATLEAAINQSRLNVEKIEYIARQKFAKNATDEATLSTLAEARAEAQRNLQMNQLNLSIAERIVATKLMTMRQAEEIAGTELAVGGKAKELIAREGVTAAVLKEALAKEKTALAGAQDALVSHQQAAAKGELGIITSDLNIKLAQEEIQLRKNNIRLLQNAVGSRQAAAGQTAAAAAAAAHTTAQHALGSAMVQNRWLGVSLGGSMAQMGSGARLAGFDVGFMTFALGGLSIAAAVAVSGMNLLADETSSIDQLRFGVEKLSIAWDSLAFDEHVRRLRDATGETAVEIREVMATLTAVTGGLIRTQDQLVESTELVLDIIRRTDASAQLASRIVARTMAGNLESLRERFPGLTEEIDRLRASGASLQEMGDWGMRALRREVGGASTAISYSDRVTRDLRNSVIELGLGIGRIAAPALAALSWSLGQVADAVTALGNGLPALVVGLGLAKAGMFAFSAAAQGASVASMGWMVATGLLASPLAKLAVAAIGGALAIKGITAAVGALFAHKTAADYFDEAVAAIDRFRVVTEQSRNAQDDLTISVSETAEEWLRLVRRQSISQLLNLLRSGEITTQQFSDTLSNLGSDVDDVGDVLWEAFARGRLSQEQYAAGTEALVMSVDRAIGQFLTAEDAVFELHEQVQESRRELVVTRGEMDDFVIVLEELGVTAEHARPRVAEFFGLFRTAQDAVMFTAGQFDDMADSIREAARTEFSQFESLEELNTFLREQRYQQDLDELAQAFGDTSEDVRASLQQMFLSGELSEEQTAELMESYTGSLEDWDEHLGKLRELIVQHELDLARDRLRNAGRAGGEDENENARILAQMRQERIDAWNDYMRDWRDRIAEEAEARRQAQEDAQNKLLNSQLRSFLREKRAVWEHQQWLEGANRRRIQNEEDTRRQIETVRNNLRRAADLEREAWTNAIEATASSVTQIGSSLTGIMQDALGIKGLVWWVEGLGQVAYAAANWYNPLAATRHAAAAAAFFYAAAQAGKHGGTQTARGGGGGSARRSRVERRRQTLEEAPDQSLRSPSGLVFAQYVDVRGAVGVDGRRVGLALLGALNRGARFRSGHRLDGIMFTRNWRR